MTIIPFGCSHMATISHALTEVDYELKSKVFNLNQMNGIIGGNSNQKIIEDVYRIVNNYGLEPKFHGSPADKHFTTSPKLDNLDLENTVFYIQTTYTNRVWFPTTLDSHTSSFHSMDENGSLIYLNNNFAKKELLNFYQLYVKYFWNYHLNLLDLLQKIDMLQTYLKSKNIKFVHMFWTFGGNTREWNSLDGLFNGDFDIDGIKKQIDDILKRIDYIKPFGYETADDWMGSLLDKNENILSDTVHLNKEYSYKLFNEIIYPACQQKISE